MIGCCSKLKPTLWEISLESSENATFWVHTSQKLLNSDFLLHNLAGLTPLCLLILLLPFLVKIWGRYSPHGEFKDQVGNKYMPQGTKTWGGEHGAGIPKKLAGNNWIFLQEWCGDNNLWIHVWSRLTLIISIASPDLTQRSLQFKTYSPPWHHFWQLWSLGG